jgi:hypothetical protein
VNLEDIKLLCFNLHWKLFEKNPITHIEDKTWKCSQNILNKNMRL